MGVYVGGRERPLRLFEVLAQNRQSALGLLGRTLRARGLRTIPPRQQLSITIWLAIRRRNFTHIINTRTKRERKKERKKEKYTKLVKKRHNILPINKPRKISSRSAKRGHTYSRGQICALFKLSCVRAARSMYSKNSFSIYLSRADAIRSEYARILKRGWTLTTRRRVLSSRNCSRTWRPAYREKRGTFPTYPPSLGRRFLYHQRFRRLRR